MWCRISFAGDITIARSGGTDFLGIPVWDFLSKHQALQVLFQLSDSFRFQLFLKLKLVTNSLFRCVSYPFTNPYHPCMVYLPTWLVDFYGKCYGKYTYQSHGCYGQGFICDDRPHFSVRLMSLVELILELVWNFRGCLMAETADVLQASMALSDLSVNCTFYF